MKCEICKKKEGIINFSEEPNAALRGYGSQKICRQCYIKIIEKELKNIQENLKEQKKLLKESGEKNVK